jgi:hypothetical protein
VRDFHESLTNPVYLDASLPALIFRSINRATESIVSPRAARLGETTSRAHVKDSGLRILHRTTIHSGRAFDPPPELGFPTTELDTSGPCPFEEGAAWCEGYVGFRWGEWQSRATPH